MSPRTLPAAAFPAGGITREAEGDRPLVLVPGKVWTVRAGRIDVFATRIDAGEPVGGRTHLFRVEQGGALFGVGADAASGMSLLAVGATGTVLDEHEMEAVRALGDEPAARPRLAALVSGWVEALYDGIAPRAGMRRFALVEAGAAAELAEGASLRPAGRVGWIEQTEGSSHLLGRADAPLAAGDLVPLSHRGWADAAGPGAVRAWALEALLAGEGPGAEAAWAGLHRLHRLALEGVAARVRDAEAAHRERMRARARESRSAMAAALSRLASPLEDVRAGSGAAMRLRGSDGEEAENTLFAAFRMVCEAQAIDPEPGAAVPTAGVRDPLAALGRACRVRLRRVALRSDWWRRDNGPLLAFTAEGNRAVALLPLPRGGYELCDPGERTRAPVTEESAALLAPFAQAIYRPFSPGALRLLEVARFGMHGARRDLFTVLAVAGAMALLGLVAPLAVGALFDTIIPGAERGQLLQLTWVLVVCALATAVFQVVRGIALLRIETRAGAAIQAAVWDRLIALPLPFFRGYTAGDLAVRAMGVEEIRRLLSGSVVNALLAGVFSLVNFGLLYSYDASLAVVATLLVGVAFAATLLAGWLQLRSARAVLKLRARNAGVVLQLLAGIGKIKMVGAETQAFGMWARLFGEQRQRQFRSRTVGSWLAVFNAVFPVLCSLALYSAAAPRLQAAEEPLATGTFLGFVAAFNLCLQAALTASNAAIQAWNAVPLYEQVAPILHTPPEVSPGKADPGELAGALEVQGAVFRYAADGPQILKGISFRVRPGEFVAFVGPSGSGKSTLFRLLLGFEHPEAGSISYDEQDLSGLDVQAVRRQIGVVLQSGRVMGGDLYTNIVGASLATLDDAWEAARMAGLDEDIRAMPMGMHTMVDDGGTTLSGGQRQRLMIARAIVHRPRILLFDEATSALDNRTQAIVSQSLDRLEATRVVIAHRLSTIQNADRIYVLQGGVIVESGTYTELMDRGGVFAAMAARQIA